MQLHRDRTPDKRIRIDIYTFKKNKAHTTMTDEKTKQSRFICSICLNSKSVKNEKIYDTNRKTKSCPVCQRNVEPSGNLKCHESEYLNCKKIQTSQTNLNDGLHLLNEVLTVFQNKKEEDKRNVKDASIGTDHAKNVHRNLNISKVFNFSISHDRWSDNYQPKCIVIDCHQPFIKSKSSIALTKHKSSSIPQMKMEELKMSLNKDKAKSKDAVEEVNRMFATVTKKHNIDINTCGGNNRPSVRSGPRVLPVVKTNLVETVKNDTGSDEDNSYNSNKTTVLSVREFAVEKTKSKAIKVDKYEDAHNKNRPRVTNKTIKMKYNDNNQGDCSKDVTLRQKRLQNLRCCPTNNYHLSGGDSLQSCSIMDGNERKIGERYMKRLETQKEKKYDVLFCECCGNRTEVDKDSRNVYTSFS